jgi:anti-sigma regulatory factor (Ser/Thr protein kinase)
MVFENEHRSVQVHEQSQPGEARRAALSLADAAGLDAVTRGNVGIVATEMATNLVRHAAGGEILLRLIDEPLGVEMLSLDRGRGMADVGRAMQDGYSTAGGAGTGLGAMVRLSDRFEVFTQTDQGSPGTALLSRIHARGSTPPPGAGLAWGAVNLPMRSESQCGDAYAVFQSGERCWFMVADGLGHGPLAAEASREAVRVFHDQAGPIFDLQQFMSTAHGALRKTRGAAVAVAEIDRQNAKVRYVGVGNIAGTILTDAGSQSMISHNGTVGMEMRKVQEFQYAWPAGATLLMHSDGLATSWRVDRYPGLLGRHPSILAGVLYRDYHRTRDDVTVLAAKEAP